MGKLYPEFIRDDLLKLSEFSKWTLVSCLPVSEDVFHPQGLIKIGSTFYLSTVDKKKNRGYLIVFEIVDGKMKVSTRVDITQGPRHKRYHPGGLDYFEKTQELWIPVAEYRRKKPTTVIALRLTDFRVRIVGELSDHIGAVICDEDNSLIRLTNWDTEGIYTAELDRDFNLKGHYRDFLYQAHLGYFRNPIWGRHGRFAYQDCKSIGGGYALCTGTRRGIAWQSGVIDLIKFGNPDRQNFELVRRFVAPPVKSPFQNHLFSIPLSRNPMMFEPVPGTSAIRFYFMPHDGPGSCLFIYEAFSENLEAL